MQLSLETRWILAQMMCFCPELPLWIYPKRVVTLRVACKVVGLSYTSPVSAGEGHNTKTIGTALREYLRQEWLCKARVPLRATSSCCK